MKDKKNEDRAVERPVREASEPHVALSLVLDVSASMEGSSINSLNTAVNTMIDEMKNNDRLKNIVDLAIFVFGNIDRKGKKWPKGLIYQGFRAIADCEPVNIEANDNSTYVVDALERAVEITQKRCLAYNSGGGSYKPWIVLITDGEFHDEAEELENIGQEMKKRQRGGKLNFFGLGVKGYKREQLEMLTEKTNRIIEVRAVNFSEFFSWIGRSMTAVSAKAVDASEELPMLKLNLN
jgi:uncharacterized protein YegL